ncbi:MAG: response regulator [Deltaproteobacteria bacterium]|nr:response regulator [Deltaproteobacteria bacterium]
MSTPIKVLMVEDSEDDAKLLVRQLRRGGYEPHSLRVETAAAMEAALAGQAWDLVISDYSLPHFSGLAALKLLKEKGLDLPFIIVSGKIGEHTAVAAMKAGAHDYIMKNNLARLIPAIERELKEAAGRQERQQAEKNLAQLQRQHEMILQAAGEGILGLDLQGKVTFVNAAAAKITGYEPEEILGQDCHKLIHYARADGTLYPRESCPSLAVLQSGEMRYVSEEVFWSKEHKSLAVEYVTSSLKENDRIIGAVMIFRDISEHKRLQEQFLQAQKMEAVGRLAGGVAHDFNNLLTVIMGCTDLLMQELKENDRLLLYNTEVMKAAHQAVGLIQQLLAFSKKQIMEPQVVNLNAVVTDMEKMLRRLIGEDIDLVTRTDESLGMVKADPGQISQVIMNLAVNARDAMPQGGRLTLETANVELDESYALKHTEVRPGPYAVLTVSDTGLGMDAETQEHIFEPFFSTKEPGKGTGLGLSTVDGIVKQSNGHIWVYSEVGRGTTFKIYLPRVREEVSAPSKKRPPGNKLEGTETVLVVEDEEVLRMLMVEALQLYGYRVLYARNGAEALKMAADYNAPIHIVLTDVVMPQMSGQELIQHLRANRPEAKVLFSSGYAPDTIFHYGELEGGAYFLQKPFRFKDLVQKIRGILDGES